MFLYDSQVTDKENGIRVDVTICDPDDDQVQFRIKSGRLDIPFFLTLAKASYLADMIQYALRKRDACDTQSSETEAN